MNSFHHTPPNATLLNIHYLYKFVNKKTKNSKRTAYSYKSATCRCFYNALRTVFIGHLWQIEPLSWNHTPLFLHFLYKTSGFPGNYS